MLRSKILLYIVVDETNFISWQIQYKYTHNVTQHKYVCYAYFIDAFACFVQHFFECMGRCYHAVFHNFPNIVDLVDYVLQISLKTLKFSSKPSHMAKCTLNGVSHALPPHGPC